MEMRWDQALSLAGAAIVLSGYALQSFTSENSYKRSYLLLNFVGASALTVTAFVNDQIGFIILEGAWTLLSVWSLTKVMLKKTS